MIWTSWSRSHTTHNKIDNQSRKAKTSMLGVWHKENLFQDTSIIGIKNSTLRISIHKREV